MDPVAAALEALGARPGAASGRVLRFAIPLAATRRAAQRLAREDGFDLQLMLAADRRRDLGRFEVVSLFGRASDDRFVELTAGIPPDEPRFPSIATLTYPASRYEREIRDQFGLVPEGHPDPRPLVRHGFWPETYHPLRKDAVPPDEMHDDGRPFPFQLVEGEGLYEIPVGPVHAGVIEPGHFRFSVDGETIVDMKSRLYFTHKGTEKLFEGRTADEGLALAERISGDTSIGHALAYCRAIEALAGAEVPPRGAAIRALLLEMERLYNHVADFGALANDTGYAIVHAHCFRIRERLLRLNKAIAGHRLLRGVIAPGGVGRDLPQDVPLARELDEVRADFEEIVAITLGNSMVLDRLRGTGLLTQATARDHGVLGPVARASGIDRDARRDHPFPPYDRLRFEVAVRPGGDVEARTLIRVDEARESIGLIRQAFEDLPGGPLRATVPPLPARQSAFSIVEGWRGAIHHWVLADDRGRLDRVKVKDPSFVNWRPLSFALLKNIVPDFPLCNKSFNLSYSGHDL